MVSFVHLAVHANQSNFTTPFSSWSHNRKVHDKFHKLCSVSCVVYTTLHYNPLYCTVYTVYSIQYVPHSPEIGDRCWQSPYIYGSAAETVTWMCTVKRCSSTRRAHALYTVHSDKHRVKTVHCNQFMTNVHFAREQVKKMSMFSCEWLCNIL